MKRRLAALTAFVVATAGGVVAAGEVRAVTSAPGGTAGRTQVSLPATGLAAVPVCPGPQTLVAPAGGEAVAPDGPVVVGAVVEGSDASPAARATLAGKALVAQGEVYGFRTLPLTSAGLVPLRASRAGAAPPLSAVQLGLARTGDLRGLSALTCSTAATQIWLVGGGTQVGRRGQLLLANPAATPAEVDVTVHGPHGAVESPPGTGVVVPAGGQVALRIDALAPELDAVAVHVRARSGRVAASLHDSYDRGVTPSGVDDVTAAAPAAARQVIPGISVASAPGSALPSSANAPGAVAVRVVNPGTGELVARVSLLGDGGAVVLPDAVLTIGPGEVRDLPVTDVPTGVYTAVVEADAPVVAGAVVGRVLPGGEVAGTSAAVGRTVPPSEFAWASSVEPLVGTTLVALPELDEGDHVAVVSALLSVAAPDGPGSVRVDELAADGTTLRTTTVLATADSGARQQLSGKAAALRLRPVVGSGPLSAALVLIVSDPSGPMIAVLPVRPGPTGSGARPHVVSDVRVGLRA